jgi:hypothetical protein
MDRVNVLSIDFDFFQKVKPETIVNYYPDGIDLPSTVSAFVWGGRYSQNEEALLEVTVDNEKITELMHIIFQSIMRKRPVGMVANSHKHIYDFINKNSVGAINLVNIDMHHDMFNDNEKVNCGNWVGHIYKERDTKLTWIANPISREVYGLEEANFDIIESNFDSIKDTTWDLIFLCRSDNWTPPHLDSDFNRIADMLMKLCSPCQYEQGITDSRYTDELKGMIEQEKKTLKELCNGIKSTNESNNKVQTQQL